MACICCGIRDLCSWNVKKLSFINIKCLWAGYDYLAILIPGNGRHWKSSGLTFQLNYAVEQCRYFCGNIPSFNTRWNYKRFQSKYKLSICITLVNVMVTKILSLTEMHTNDRKPVSSTDDYFPLWSTQSLEPFFFPVSAFSKQSSHRFSFSSSWDRPYCSNQAS